MTSCDVVGGWWRWILMDEGENMGVKIGKVDHGFYMFFTYDHMI